MRYPVLALGIFLLIVFLSGCTGSQPQGNATSQPQAQPATAPNATTVSPSVPLPQNQSQPSDWNHYSNIGISFDYPKEMSVSESTGSYPASASIIAKDQNGGSIGVSYTNASASGAKGSEDPLQVTSDFLSRLKRTLSDAMNKSIANGSIVSGSVSDVSKQYSPNGIGGAEFSYVVANTNSTGYGYALQFYVPGRTAIYTVFILTPSRSESDMIKSRFMSSFTVK